MKIKLPSLEPTVCCLGQTSLGPTLSSCFATFLASVSLPGDGDVPCSCHLTHSCPQPGLFLCLGFEALLSFPLALLPHRNTSSTKPEDKSNVRNSGKGNSQPEHWDKIQITLHHLSLLCFYWGVKSPFSQSTASWTWPSFTLTFFVLSFPQVVGEIDKVLKISARL